MSKHLTKLLSLLSAILLLTASSPAAERFKNAEPGYRFLFPRDHGAHPDFRIEWWYFTGNLIAGGKEYGYELTFFRRGMEHLKGNENPSRWAVRDLYVAHFALTDPGRKRFRYADKISRAALGKAGAESDRLAVWIDRWRAVQENDGTIHLLAEEKEGERSFKIDLTLNPVKPLVIHGTDGISRKGNEAGQASYYYSFTRLDTKGTLSIDGEKSAVSGFSWMDHEFGSSLLNKQQVGWDWFSIQLDDGSEWMLFQIRTVAGGKDLVSSGTAIAPDGTARHIEAAAFELTPLGNWKSGASGGTYPVRWRITIPSEQIFLESEPLLEYQELITARSTRVIYWEGASRFRGTKGDHPISGKGYLEMTGYGKGGNLLQTNPHPP